MLMLLAADIITVLLYLLLLWLAVVVVDIVVSLHRRFTRNEVWRYRSYMRHYVVEVFGKPLPCLALITKMYTKR